jgi:hypothetical protein
MKTSLPGRKHCADTPTQLALTARERCRAIAGGHDVLPQSADDCVDGSVGCHDCPWPSGWSPTNLRVHRIRPMPSPTPQSGPTQ